MATKTVFPIKHRGVGAVDIPHGGRQCRWCAGHDDEMRMVAHQNVVPNIKAVAAGIFVEQLEIEVAVLRVDENIHPPVTPLRDMMWKALHADTRASHILPFSQWAFGSIGMTRERAELV
jgi:hypothetical protein